jgi:UDP-N-acetylglucosamine 1-carboxyvinyltransferase
MTTTRAPGMAAEVIAVRPGPPLTGTVTVDGSKNAALPLLAAAAALGRSVRLSNIPANTDVQIMLSNCRRQAGTSRSPSGLNCFLRDSTVPVSGCPVQWGNFMGLRTLRL